MKALQDWKLMTKRRNSRNVTKKRCECHRNSLQHPDDTNSRRVLVLESCSPRASITGSIHALGVPHVNWEKVRCFDEIRTKSMGMSSLHGGFRWALTLP